MAGTLPLQNIPVRSEAFEALVDEVEPLSGYPKVATFMGEYPQMAMFRRFRALNARNLLYLQAELVQLENALLKREIQDAGDKTNSPKKHFSKNWEWLVRFKDDNEENVQYKLITKMRGLLKEYNEVLIQQATLTKIPKPSDNETKVMQQWFVRRDQAGMPIDSDDGSIWAHEDESDPESPKGVSRYLNDMIAIGGSSDEIDRTTHWIAEKLIPNYHARIASRWHKGIHAYDEANIYRSTAMIATTLSSLLPVLSIVILYVVHSVPARLGIIAGFTASFSLLLTLFTGAKRIENFAATSAFAAVQIIFVGTNINNDTRWG